MKQTGSSSVTVWISNWEQTCRISFLTKHYKDEIGVISWLCVWIEWRPTCSQPTTADACVQHPFNSEWTTHTQTHTDTHRHTYNQDSTSLCDCPGEEKAASVFLSHLALGAEAHITLDLICIRGLHVVRMSSLSYAQYALYPGQERPMDKIQCYSSGQQSEDYYKLLAHSIDLLVISSSESVQQQLPLIS